MRTLLVIAAAIALGACGANRLATAPLAPPPDKPRVVEADIPVARSCVDPAFPHMPAVPDGPSLRQLPDFAARDAAVKGAYPGLIDWAMHAEAQINLCR